MIATWRALYSQAMHHSIFCQKVTTKYRKTPEISLGAYIFQRPFLRGLFLEGLIFGGAYLWGGNLHFKIDWASLILGSKFIVFALFYFVSEGNFPRTSHQGALEGQFNRGFFALPVWGAY